MTRSEKAAELIRAYAGTANAFGIRSDDRHFALGQSLPCSRIWVDGDPTEELLDGVSVTGIRYAEDADKALRLNERCYNYGQPMYLVAGDFVGYGEDDGEYILADAVVIGIL